MPDQKPMWTRCLGGFYVMWVTKLLISPVKNRIFCSKMTKFSLNLAFLSITGSFGAPLVGWLVVLARGLYLGRHLFTLSCSTFFFKCETPTTFTNDSSERKLDHKLDQVTHPGLLYKAAKAEWHKRIQQHPPWQHSEKSQDSYFWLLTITLGWCYIINWQERGSQDLKTRKIFSLKNIWGYHVQGPDQSAC